MTPWQPYRDKKRVLKTLPLVVGYKILFCTVESIYSSRQKEPEMRQPNRWANSWTGTRRKCWSETLSLLRWPAIYVIDRVHDFCRRQPPPQLGLSSGPFRREPSSSIVSNTVWSVDCCRLPSRRLQNLFLISTSVKLFLTQFLNDMSSFSPLVRIIVKISVDIYLIVYRWILANSWF